MESACLAKLRGRVRRLVLAGAKYRLFWGAKPTLMVILTSNLEKMGVCGVHVLVSMFNGKAEFKKSYGGLRIVNHEGMFKLLSRVSSGCQGRHCPRQLTAAAVPDRNKKTKIAPPVIGLD